jgi:fibronectin-binding autotransporter adhesin
VLGGITYGAQNYRNIRQGDAPTVAAAMRYSFDDPFGDKDSAFRPYAELGTWITPRASLTLTRSYADLVTGGTDVGQGSTNETSWAEYARGGMVWSATKEDQLTGYGELGQQYMSFDGYTESANAGNPFPATVGGGLFRMGVARIGGSWTHDLWRQIYAPISLTIAGDMARSFNVHPGLGATFLGAASTNTNDSTDMWGEFGARIEARFTDRLALDLDLNGTTGGGTMGTVLHGGVDVVLRF